MTEPPYVRLERRGAVALVVMDNPATLNAMDHDMGPRLAGALEDLAIDDTVRVVVLTGANGAFSAGANLVRVHNYMQDNPGQGGGSVFESYTKWVHRVLAALVTMPQPVISAVEGAASGAGLGWFLASDFVIAAEDAKLLSGFVAVGLVPAAGVTLTLPRLAGLPRAAQALMFSQPLSPRDALEWGLVDSLCPAGKAVEQSLALAEELCAKPQKALAATKKLLGLAGRQGVMTQAEDERRAVMIAADHPEFAERAARFAGKNRAASPGANNPGPDRPK